MRIDFGTGKKKPTDKLSVLIVGWWPNKPAGNMSCPGGAGGDDFKNPHC